MADIDQMARAAGFFKSDGYSATSNREKTQAFGMDVVTSPIMPEGYIALRSEKGATIISPAGKTWWVPFYGASEKAR